MACAKGVSMNIKYRVSPVSRRLQGWRRVFRQIAHVLQGTLIIETHGAGQSQRS